MTSTAVLQHAESIGRSLARALMSIEAGMAWGEVPAVMDEHLTQLADLECWGDANPIPSSVFWRESGEVLQRGSLQAHARFKPHGYAGDFEMLERLVQREIRGEGLAGAFDRYFQSHSAPQAVRNRTHWVANRIVELNQRSVNQRSEQPLKIVSVGSGPAADIWQAVSSMRAESCACLQVTLLDLDGRALEFASQRLLQVLNPDQLVVRRENLFRLPRRKGRISADLIFCTGLFDYLPDESAVEMLRWMCGQCAPEGELVMMNFSPRNRSRAYMEWAGTWYLIHRTEEEMAALADRAKLPQGSWQLSEEPERIDLILQARPQGAI